VRTIPLRIAGNSSFLSRSLQGPGHEDRMDRGLPFARVSIAR
jgi:hypothetical protein